MQNDINIARISAVASTVFIGKRRYARILPEQSRTIFPNFVKIIIINILETMTTETLREI